MNYYNDNDPKACAWIRELIAEKLIPPGHIDGRSISEVQPEDLRGFTQCHFFAGIAGWSLALRIARWPDSRPVWSGSCPCPPFSAAGKKTTCARCLGKPIPHPLKTGVFACIQCGHEWLGDARHLWPEFLRLIRQCRPAEVFGEQVASFDGLVWLAGVRATLEALTYGVGGSDLCAAGVRAPHIRQRLWWVAQSEGIRRERRDALARFGHAPDEPERQGTDGRRMVEPNGAGWQPGEFTPQGARHGGSAEPAGGAGGMAYVRGQGLPGRAKQPARKERSTAQRGGGAGQLGDAERDGREQGADAVCSRQRQPAGPGEDGRLAHPDERGRGTGRTGEAPSTAALQPHDTGFWDRYELIPCADGKVRRVEPGVEPLAYGVPGRVGLLRGYGNAIVPEVAANFIEAYLTS